MIYLSNTSSHALAFFSEVIKWENFPFITSRRSLEPSTRSDISSCLKFSFLVISEIYRLRVIASWFARYPSLLSYLLRLKSSVMTYEESCDLGVTTCRQDTFHKTVLRFVVSQEYLRLKTYDLRIVVKRAPEQHHKKCGGKVSVKNVEFIISSQFFFSWSYC